MNDQDKKSPVIFLMGPTASGKTDLAIALAQRLPLDIISVDSALIYRGMDIGTAKPSADELAQAPHALIDICDPTESYSVADFYRDAQHEIEQSHQANRIPILVGGTMMYFNALLNGLADMPATDDATRLAIETEAQEKGWPAMHALLNTVDPETAAEIHPNHSHRIARALAVFRMSGKTMSSYRQAQIARQASDKQMPDIAHEPSLASGMSGHYDVQQFALIPQDRMWLHERINKRYRLMLENGFVEEVEMLFQRGDLHGDLPSMRSVGYRQVWQMLNGEYDYATMIEKGQAATRQLAKRQLTWLRNWSSLCSLPVDLEKGSLMSNFEENLKKTLNSLRV